MPRWYPLGWFRDPSVMTTALELKLEAPARSKYIRADWRVAIPTLVSNIFIQSYSVPRYQSVPFMQATVLPVEVMIC